MCLKKRGYMFEKKGVCLRKRDIRMFGKEGVCV